MKRFFTLFMALFLLTVSGLAQDTPFVLGYCDGQIATVGTAGFVTSEKKVWVSGAVYIPAGQARALAGDELRTIRAGLATKSQIDSLRVWVRTSLDGEDLVSGLMTTTTSPALNKGWNEFNLDTPYVIPEDSEGFYLGYSFHQKSKAMALSIILDPQPNGLFVQYGNGEWTDYSATGVLCIEGFVYGDNMPMYDLQLDNISAGKYMALKNPQLEVTCNVRNLAMATINNYKAVCQFEGYDETITVDINQPIAYKERKQVKFTINPEMITSVPDGPVKMTVTLQDLDGHEDISPENNSAQASFLVIDNVFARNVLVENFTTEVCPNCPRVAGWLHSTLEKPAFGNVILWEHHSGYYTDSYTTPFDQTYMWFYNDGGSTYAPALMFDRVPQPAEQNTTPVTLPGTQAAMENLMTARLDEPAFVDVHIKAGYQEDGKLKVIVTGERIQPGFTVNPPRITVALVEDNIVTNSQSGASGAFTHRNVGRAVNSTWGEVIEWNGNNYRYEYAFNVADGWNKDNLAIVAFVSDYDSTNPTACDVANAALLTAANFGDITEEPDYVLHYGVNEDGVEWQDVTFVPGEGENEGKLVAANVEFAANTEFKVNYGEVWYGGATEDNYYLIHNEWFENIPLDAAGQNFRINEAGTYTFVLDVAEDGIKMTVTGWPEPEQKLYLIGDAPLGGWDPAAPIEMVEAEGVYTYTATIAEAKDYYFVFTTATGTWADVNSHRYGPTEANQDVVVGEETATQLSTNDQAAYKLAAEAGEYTFTFDMANLKFMVNKIGTPSVPGDANGDGLVDISDVNSVINQMLGKEAMIPACDMNGDGKIDISDVNAVINKMLGK